MFRQIIIFKDLETPVYIVQYIAKSQTDRKCMILYNQRRCRILRRQNNTNDSYMTMPENSEQLKIDAI